MDKTHLIKNKYIILASIVLWLIVASVSISESVFYYKVNNRPIPFGRIFIWDMNWLLWALITPLTLRILFYFLENGKKTRKTVITITTFTFTLAIIHVLIETILAFWLSPIFFKTRTFWSIFLDIFTYKTHTNILIILALTGVTIAMGHWQKAKSLKEASEQQQSKLNELQRQLAESKLELLRRQLKPHFLFNTLHVISGLIIKKSYDQSLEMIAKLSDLLRLSLQYNDQQLIPLKEELKLMQLYLEIHQIRFGENFQLEIDTPHEYENALVPSFILQPIAENAIIHGIVPNMNKGCISLKVACEEQTLYIQIKDDGVGLKNGVLLKEGIGIQNCRKRLSNLYKAKHGLTLDGKPMGGFTTTLYFPYQKIPA